MLNSLVNWSKKVVYDGTNRATYHKNGYYKAPVSKRLKAALLILTALLGSGVTTTLVVGTLALCLGPIFFVVTVIVVFLFFFIYGVLLDA